MVANCATMSMYNDEGVHLVTVDYRQALQLGAMDNTLMSSIVWTTFDGASLSFVALVDDYQLSAAHRLGTQVLRVRIVYGQAPKITVSPSVCTLNG